MPEHAQPTHDSEPMRLQKYLARAGVGSRRACEGLIEQGLVQVNGQVATLGMSVNPATDEVVYQGSRVQLPTATVVLLLNKPAGYLTSLSDPHHTRFVTDLVPTDEYPGLFPVGRLDKDTQGLLLLTNDGELGNYLMHPKNQVDKTYRATVRASVSNATLQKLEKGVELEDGLTAPAQVKLIERTGAKSVLEITIHEGRNRQVRRMCDAVGHPVMELERIRYAHLTLDGVARGRFRKLTEAEVEALKN